LKPKETKMRHPLRALALACVLSLTPACASLQPTRIENPIEVARTLDQRGYALLHAYAALLEEAADIVRDPATPPSVTRALAQAERVATPAMETLEIALAAYLRARADGQAVQRLGEAIAAAQAPLAELQTLIRGR
jgi:hypothetical protein